MNVFGPEHVMGGPIADASRVAGGPIADLYEKVFGKPDESPDAPMSEVERARELAGGGHRVSTSALGGSGVTGAVEKFFPKTDAEKAATCAAWLPGFVCEGRTPGFGDVPWWVWALLGTGVVGFGVMSYVSYKAAPYVLPIVVPESAPFAQAWIQARSTEDKQKVAQEALAALAAARRAQGTSKTSYQNQLASYGARQEAAGRELRARMAGG